LAINQNQITATRDTCKYVKQTRLQVNQPGELIYQLSQMNPRHR